MELNELLQARKILANHINDKVCATLAYKMMKFLKSSDNEEEFYLTKIRELIDKYGEKDGEGKPVYADNGNIKIEQSKVKECENEIENLGKTDVAEPTIKFNLLELSELKLSAKEMYALDNFVIET